MSRRVICTLCGSEIAPDEEVTIVKVHDEDGTTCIYHNDCICEIIKMKASEITDEFIEKIILKITYMLWMFLKNGFLIYQMKSQKLLKIAMKMK